MARISPLRKAGSCVPLNCSSGAARSPCQVGEVVDETYAVGEVLLERQFLAGRPRVAQFQQGDGQRLFITITFPHLT